jgi:hypothetical protein
MKLKKSVKVASLIVLEILTVIFCIELDTDVPMGFRLLLTSILLICENMTMYIEGE